MLGFFVCSYGPDNLVTLLSSGAGSPCSPEPPCVPPRVPEIHPPPTTTQSTPHISHRATPTTSATAILRQPLMEDPLDVSLKNHLLSIFIQPPAPAPVSHPYLGRCTTVINIHQGDARCEDATASVPPTPTTTTAPTPQQRVPQLMVSILDSPPGEILCRG